MNGEAEVKYLDGDFRVVRPGAFVRCAVTGVPIPLEELKYWSVDLQEAYVSPEAVLQRLKAERAASGRAPSPSAARNSPASSICSVTGSTCARCDQRRERGIAGHARVVLFGGEQGERVALGGHQQFRGVLGSEAMMVGKGAPRARSSMPACLRASRRICPDRRCRRRPAPAARCAPALSRSGASRP